MKGDKMSKSVDRHVQIAELVLKARSGSPSELIEELEAVSGFCQHFAKDFSADGDPKLAMLADMTGLLATAMAAMAVKIPASDVGKRIRELRNYARLQTRVKVILRREGIELADQLCNMTEIDLLELRNCGETSLAEIKQFMSDNDLELK